MKFIHLSLALYLSLFIPAFADAPRTAVSLSARGMSGMNGMNGRDYGFSRATDGRDGFSGGSRGGDGSDGSHGGDASKPTDGRNGGTILFYLAKHATKPDTAVYSAKVNGEEIAEQEIAITPETKFILDASGGRGGSGGAGGSGQDGGDGGQGGDADRFSPRAGSGGRGGRGGNPGRSSNGGDGGNGGSIQVFIRAGDESLMDLVQYSVDGGQGGFAPIGRANPGDGGRGGRPGNNCYYDQNNARKCGSSGMSGMNGMSGNPSGGFPSSGMRGQNGSFEVKNF